MRDPDQRMHLWRVTMRHLSVSSTERKPFDYVIANYETSEKESIAWFRDNWGSPEWWSCVLLQDITYVGELHLNAASATPGTPEAMGVEGAA